MRSSNGTQQVTRMSLYLNSSEAAEIETESKCGFCQQGKTETAGGHGICQCLMKYLYVENAFLDELESKFQKE